ncbi:hypothetical protein MC885_013865 [Smutsia gigantea]|nr:hypothetical protein MC885_013865 [Smutsia gigantea]
MNGPVGKTLVPFPRILAISCIGQPPKKDRHPDGHRDEANEVHHDGFSARSTPARLVDGSNGKDLGRQEAGHIEKGVKGHEDHLCIATKEAGIGSLDNAHQLHCQQEEEDIPDAASVEELYDRGDEEEREETCDH